MNNIDYKKKLCDIINKFTKENEENEEVKEHIEYIVYIVPNDNNKYIEKNILKKTIIINN